MKDGGPAFPSTYYWNEKELGYRPSSEGGMSLRDYFAAAALQGLVAGITKFRDDIPDIIVNRPIDVSEIAYTYADAMLEARK